MGYYLQRDTEEAQPLASNQGYADLRAWVNSLPVVDSAALRHLCEQGWTGKTRQLLNELNTTIIRHRSTRTDVRTTAENLRDLVQAGEWEVVSVTDGLGEDD